MSYELFWHGEPSLYSIYLDAYNRKQKQDYEEFINRENFKAWLHGRYIDIALACNNPFAKSKKDYISQPIEFKLKDDPTGNEITDSDSSKELSKKEEEQAIAQFMAFGQVVSAFNKKRKKNDG